MAWIELHETIGTHKKTYALAEELGIPQYAAVGILCLMWTWALGAAQDGNLSAFPPHAIARACFWTKQPSYLVDALVKCGWLDGDMHIHDWYEYAGRLIEKREDTRKRVAAYRSRTKPACNAYSNADVTRYVTSTKHVGNASTVPNRTVPNQNHKDSMSVCNNEPREDTQTDNAFGLSLEEARQFQDNADAIRLTAKRCGFTYSDAAISKAMELLSRFGMEKLTCAMQEVALKENGKQNWPYLIAKLEDRGKLPEKDRAAQSDVQDFY